MHNITVIEKCFKKYLKEITSWPPENIISVDLALLKEMDLLNYHTQGSADTLLTRYFHVVEAPEKITLINEEFIVWIVPEKIDNKPVTYTMIALNADKEPRLELAFIVSGVYNTSQMVLRVLEKMLFEIQENEELLGKLK